MFCNRKCFTQFKSMVMSVRMYKMNYFQRRLTQFVCIWYISHFTYILYMYIYKVLGLCVYIYSIINYISKSTIAHIRIPYTIHIYIIYTLYQINVEHLAHIIVKFLASVVEMDWKLCLCTYVRIYKTSTRKVEVIYFDNIRILV